LHTYFEHHELAWDVLSFALHEDENDTDIGFNAYTYRRVDEAVWSEFIVCEGEDRMVKIRTNLVGHEHAWYLSLAYEIAQIIAVRKNLYFPIEQSIDVSVDLQPWRMHRFAWKWWSILLDSSYNASPWSMRMMIRLLTDMRQQLFPERKLVFCLGEMRELWNESKSAHELLVKQILHADKLFLIWQDIHDYLLPELFASWYGPDRVAWFCDAISLWKALDIYLSEQQELSLVLFKWSQNTIFLEEAVKQVLRFPEDVKKLCRQDARRLQKKSK
jgi:UDP-N-acetylmuramyl pentapeptide synthase